MHIAFFRSKNIFDQRESDNAWVIFYIYIDGFYTNLCENVLSLNHLSY